MSYKIVISKPTKEVLTETNPNNLIFSSDYNTLKYYLSGNATATILTDANPFAQEDTIITHNLGYRPFFVAFIKESGLTRYYNAPYYFASGGFYIGFYVYLTTTTLILRTEMSSNISEFDFTVWYKIFKNNTNL